MRNFVSSHKGVVIQAKADRANRKADRRAQREAERADRVARGETGAPIDWSASTTVAQFPSAYDDSNPIVAGVGRTLSRGLL
jgi:hypothetical protein